VTFLLTNQGERFWKGWFSSDDKQE
jgi:hypothetical protein